MNGPGPGPGYDYNANGSAPGQGYPMAGPGPGQGPGYDPYAPAPGPGEAHAPGPGYHPGNEPGPRQDYPASGSAPRRPRPSDGSGRRRAALVVQALADIAAVFLGLWIVLYLLEANQGNPFVEFVRGMAEWLGWWAQDIFTMELEGVRIFLNYGLPAAIYLFIGHGVAAWLRRL